MGNHDPRLCRLMGSYQVLSETYPKTKPLSSNSNAPSMPSSIPNPNPNLNPNPNSSPNPKPRVSVGVRVRAMIRKCRVRVVFE